MTGSTDKGPTHEGSAEGGSAADGGAPDRADAASRRVRFRRVDELFQAVCELPAGERASRLGELEPADGSIRAEVMSLLEAEAEVTGIARLGGGELLDRLAATLGGPAERPAQIAGFRIVGLLGRGGMGVVYEAEQRQPARSVALKVLEPSGSGWTSPELVRRFEFEAEALGRLRHPGIAQVHEAGVADTPAGPRPYFAMELVRGRPLDAWASRDAAGRAPGLPRVMDVLASVCDAVQHAHARGIIHRDLKPANVLVGEDGGEVSCKVLDFGIARAVDPGQRMDSLHTGVGRLVGTLPYMSPEQVGVDAGDIDTRTDVYSLGVVMYQVLAGRLPFDLAGRHPVEAAELIARGGAERLGAIDPRFRGDIETIVATAMHPDPGRRYQTAAAMADDIRRHLASETIAARPPSVTYQLSRLARRHRAAFGGAFAAVLALGIGATVSSAALIGQSRARAEGEALNLELARSNSALADENRRFEAVISFLESMLTRANPASASNDETTLLEVLDAAAEGIAAGEAESEVVEASLRRTLGATYGWMGYHDDAVAMLRPSLEIHRRLYGEIDLATTDTLKLLSRFVTLTGDAAAGKEMIGDTPERLLEIETVTDQHRLAAADLLRVRAISMKVLNEVDEARGSLTLAESIYTDIASRGVDIGGSRGEVWNELGSLHHRRGEHREADEAYARSLAIYAAVYGDDSARYATVLSNRAIVQRDLGRAEDAIPMYRRSIEILEGIFGDDSPGQVMTPRTNLGTLLVNLGRLEEAVPVLEQSVREHERVLPAGHFRLGFALVNLGEARHALWQTDAALHALARGRGLLVDHFGPEQPYVVRAMQSHAAALDAAGRADDAAAESLASVHAARTGYGEESPWLPGVMLESASVLARHGRAAEARQMYERSVAHPANAAFDGTVSAAVRAAQRRVEAEILVAEGRAHEALNRLDRWWGWVGTLDRIPYRRDWGRSVELRASLLLTGDPSPERRDDARSMLAAWRDVVVASLGVTHPRVLELERLAGP